MDNEKKVQTSKSRAIVWEAEEFKTYKRDSNWYILVSVILILIAAYTIYIQKWVLLAVVIMVGVVMYMSGSIKPRKIKYLVDDSGVLIGERLFGYDELKSFWFSDASGENKLNLISTIKLMPVISIMINLGDKEKIREILAKYLPESKNQGEDWIDKINRMMKI